MSEVLDEQISDTRVKLLEDIKLLDNKSSVFRSNEIKALFSELKAINQPEERAKYGKLINDLRLELEQAIKDIEDKLTSETAKPIDVTAPFDINEDFDSSNIALLPTEFGSIHPINQEFQTILDIFYRLGFESIEAPEIDDDYHMFGALNFPEGHPARDDFDTLLTKQLDSNGKPYVAPAHTSTMQVRVLQANKHLLERGEPIAYVIPGRVFRNEDVDPRHEHTFYQLEGIYIGKNVTVANLMFTLQTFMSAYFNKSVELKTQPFYFPFTEPSFEFAISCPFCDKKGCNVCSYSGWLELLGCGLTHPNVFREAGINSEEFTGFAFGIGIMRLAMVKFGIDDIRYFQNGRLDFLRQFK